MRDHNIKYIVLGLILSIGLSGCLTTNLAPVTSSDYSAEEDEKRIWLRSEEEQELLNESGMIYEDKKLEAYLNRVGKKLQPPEVYEKIPFRIRVLKNPYSNAFAYPNGAVYVHSGLLAKMDNEAQLATLLAHEMTHATHRHQVREFRGIKNRSAVMASMGATFGDLGTALGEIGFKASVSGYSKGLETEADMEGIKLVEKAGYDLRETPKLFYRIKEELEEADIKEPFFFGSHPRTQERINNYESYLKSSGSGKKGIRNAKTFMKKISGAIYENALLELQAGRFEKAERGVKKYLTVWPRSPKAHYLYGEIKRQQGEKDDLKEAKKYYRKAIKLNPSYANAHKGLGLLHFKQGNKKEARKAFKLYLELSPKADDREYFKEYIAQCK